MRRLIQFVALALVAFLVAPPAASLCQLVPTQPAAMACCNADSLTAQRSIAPSPSVNLDCDQGCCSVAPSPSSVPAAPDKFKAASFTPDAAQAVHSLPLDVPRLFAPVAVAPVVPALDLQVMLHTFRI